MALDSIIGKFGENVAPFAVQLIEKLAQAFGQFAAAGDEDDSSGMAALESLDAINTVLAVLLRFFLATFAPQLITPRESLSQSVHNRPELYPLLEAHLIPVLQLLLREDGEFIEYFENALDIIVHLTFFSKRVSKDMWGIFPMIFHAFDNWAYDYIANIVTPIDNYISLDPNTFLAGGAVMNGVNVSYVEMVFKMVQKVMTANLEVDEQVEIDNDESSSEKAEILWLVISLLHNCKVRMSTC